MNISYKKKVFILIILVVCLMSACRQTPENAAVNQRSYKALLQTAPSDYRLIYPETYTDSFMSKDKKVSISFDARIIVPDVQKYPVLLIDSHPITDEQIHLVADEFMEGSMGTYPERYMTKGEVEAKLIELKARIIDVDGLYEKYGEKSQVDAVIGSLKGKLEKYNAMLPTAPLSKQSIASNTDFRPDAFYYTDDYNYIKSELNITQEALDAREQSGSKPLYLVSDVALSNGEYIRLYGYNEPPAKLNQPHNFGMHSMEHYEIQIIRGDVPFIEKMDYPISSAYPFNDSIEGGSLDAAFPELTISLDEAVAMAQQTMSNMGLEDYYLAHSNIRKQMPTYEEYEAFWKTVMENPDVDMEDIRETKEDKFYMLTFKPIYYDIPYMNANNQFSQEMRTNVLFAFEEVKVRVANDCIAEFRMININNTMNVINDNVKILDFDEIIKIAVNHMKLKYNIETVSCLPVEMEDYEQMLSNYLNAEINITEIRLGLAGVPAYNNPMERMLIPVWNFYGTYSYDTADDTFEMQIHNNVTPFVSINAADGSIIEQYGWQDCN